MLPQGFTGVSTGETDQTAPHFQLMKNAKATITLNPNGKQQRETADNYDILYVSEVADRRFDCRGTSWVKVPPSDTAAPDPAATCSDMVKKYSAMQRQQSQFDVSGEGPTRPTLRVYLASPFAPSANDEETLQERYNRLNEAKAQSKAVEETKRNDIPPCSWSYTKVDHQGGEGHHDKRRIAHIKQTNPDQGAAGVGHVCYLEFGCEHVVNAKWATYMGTFGINSLRGPWNTDKCEMTNHYFDVRNWVWGHSDKFAKPSAWPTKCDHLPENDRCRANVPSPNCQYAGKSSCGKEHADIWKLLVDDEDCKQQFLYTQPRNVLFGCRVNTEGSKRTRQTSDDAKRRGAEINKKRMDGGCDECKNELNALRTQFLALPSDTTMHQHEKENKAISEHNSKLDRIQNRIENLLKTVQDISEVVVPTIQGVNDGYDELAGVAKQAWKTAKNTVSGEEGVDDFSPRSGDVQTATAGLPQKVKVKVEGHKEFDVKLTVGQTSTVSDLKNSIAKTIGEEAAKFEEGKGSMSKDELKTKLVDAGWWNKDAAPGAAEIYFASTRYDDKAIGDKDLLINILPNFIDTGKPIEIEFKPVLHRTSDADAHNKNAWGKASLTDANEIYGAVESVTGALEENTKARVAAEIGRGALMCGMGVAAAVASTGVLASTAISACVPFLASVSKFIIMLFKKKTLDPLYQRREPPAFMEELEWTEEYLDEFSKVSSMSPRPFGKERLTMKTMNRLQCQVNALRQYTETRVGGVVEAGVDTTNDARIEKFAGKYLGETRVLLVQALQVRRFCQGRPRKRACAVAGRRAAYVLETRIRSGPLLFSPMHFEAKLPSRGPPRLCS